jgi:urease subunit alpha
MFGSFGRALERTSVTFVSGAALAAGVGEKYGVAKSLLAVADTRSIGKADMKLNDYRPRIEVDPENYRVRADGTLLTCEPATVLPLAQRYFLF